MKRAWTQIKEDVDETGIDRLELLTWSIQTLMSAAGQAKQQKNPGAFVPCIKKLDWIKGVGDQLNIRATSSWSPITDADKLV